jgi:hypothetical protein
MIELFERIRNNRGVYGVPSCEPPKSGDWDWWISELKGMHIAWYKLLDDGHGSSLVFANKLLENNIIPIVRVYRGEPYPGTLPGDHLQTIREYVAAGVILFETGNQPNLPAEWKSDWRDGLTYNSPEHINAVVDGWLTDAEQVLDSGGFPSFPALAPTDRNSTHPTFSSVMWCAKMMDRLRDEHQNLARDFFARGVWLAVHNSPRNRPFDFDPNRGDFWDDCCLQGYKVYLTFLKEKLNVRGVPIIFTEGGVYTPERMEKDGWGRSYEYDSMAQKTLETYNWLARNAPQVVAVCPWVLANRRMGHYDERWDGDEWYRPDGELPVVTKLKGEPPVERVTRTFRCFGRVIGVKTQRGVEGLQVEAWDKDMIVDKAVGTAVTDGGGAFQMQFKESYFKELFSVLWPDLHFKVFRGDKLIKSTEDSVLWNIDKEDVEMVIRVDEPAEQLTKKSEAMGLQAASRSILQATYTPRQPRPGEDPSMAPRALEKGAFFAHLAPSQEELGELADRYRQEPTQPDTGDTTATEIALRAVEILSNAISPTGKINVLRSGKQFADLKVDTLVRIAQDLIELRQETLNTVLDAHATILEEFTRASSPEIGVRTILSLPSVGLKTLMEWAVRSNVQGESAAKSLALAEKLSLDVQTLKPAQFGTMAARQIDCLCNLLNTFREEMDVERVGYLHLERMSFVPAGIERGELVYSVPLSPGEEVNIKHREWSRVSEEFERIVTDYLEEFSEEGVAEKSELAESVNSQTQHSTAFNTGVTASGSYGPVSISTTVGYNASDSSSKSEQLSRNQSTDITHKASSRAKREHKISFRVASVVETEDETVQRIRNPFPDRATRVDYYQLLRKWQVSLYRYGIRLTYDIMIPEPGRGLLLKLAEIADVRRQLEVGFDSVFPLRPEDIDRETYEQTAANYGAGFVDRPQPDPRRFTDCRVFEWRRDEWEGDQWRNLTFEIMVPNDYQVDSAEYVEEGTVEYGDFGSVSPFTHLDDWTEKSGKFTALIRMKDIQTVYAGVDVTAKLRAESERVWKHKVWSQIRDAAQKQYYEDRQKQKDKLHRLEEELGSQDALSLRKKEREEAMKGVLVALGFSPEEHPADPTKIKFIHHAVEWENMLYFLYPYFWSDPEKQIGSESDKEEQKHPYWEFKKYLDHPDPMHRAFLKAGCARVVLTIRPGFEEAFLAFLDKGDMDEIPSYPYLTIAQEFENYAKTNYPGIPPANPPENVRPLLYPTQRKTWEDMQFIMKLLDNYRKFPYPTQQKAWEDMQIIMELLDEYLCEIGQYPSTEQGLAALASRFPDETVPKDPWGYDYVYKGIESIDEEGKVKIDKYELLSYGADGAPGGDGEDADITSLAQPYRGPYPSTEEGLTALVQRFPDETIPLQDAWANDYTYTCPGIYGEYELVSYGKDGKPGGEGEDADITSWAEASLIGTWYEYTPTSALDIAFDETMPKA